MRRLPICPLLPSGVLCLLGVLSVLTACQPDDSPALKGEIERLHKEAKKQEGVIVSLQDGNKVMQQQIDLLNQELRDAKKETALAEVERKAMAGKLNAQASEAKKLVADAQRTAEKKVQAAMTISVEEKGTQNEEVSKPLTVVAKGVEQALSRNGYAIRVTVKTEQKAVYVTERKISSPVSLEVPGFRNQYVVSLQALPSNRTRLSVKAEFEKMAQGGRVLAAGADEIAEIERRFIAEVTKAIAASEKA